MHGQWLFRMRTWQGPARVRRMAAAVGRSSNLLHRWTAPRVGMDAPCMMQRYGKKGCLAKGSPLSQRGPTASKQARPRMQAFRARG